MRKGLIFSLIISFIGFLFLSVFVCIPKNKDNNNFSFYNYENELIAETQNDDYSFIEISKDQTIMSLQKALNINSENNVSTLTFNMSLTDDEIVDICKENDYIVKSTENAYLVQNKYTLKRLIVSTNLKEHFGAYKVIKNKNSTILCFNTIEETKTAYQKMLKQNLPVFIDSVVTLNDTQITANDENPILFKGWEQSAICLNAFNTYNTSKETVAVVLDTGINTSHEMFENRLLFKDNKIVGFSYVSSNYSYSKNNLYFESTDTNQYSFEDDYGHGSMVSSIICNSTPSNVKILPIRVLGSNGKGSLSTITTALQRVINTYSSQYNIACVNMSLGATVDASEINEEVSYFNTLFTSLRNKNILPVVAAGNEKTTTTLKVPAACTDTAIVVSALTYKVNSLNQISGYTFASDYSNYGSSIDICAPGTLIYCATKCSANSKLTTNKYTYPSGTSMAAPVVAACVTLLYLDNQYYLTPTSSPTCNQSTIEKRLFNAAIDYGTSGKDIYYGHGVVSLKNIAEPLKIKHTASNTIATYDGKSHNININVTQPASYTIKYSLEDDNTYTITDYSNLSTFKNATNGAIPIYYQISSTDYEPVTGVQYLTINKRKLNYLVEDQTSSYGSNSHLNQNKIKLTSGSVIDGDDLNLNLTTTATKNSTIGNYPINLVYNNSNYDITNNSATLTIEKRNIDIQILNSSNVYGENLKIDNSKYVITNGSIVNGDSLNIVLDYSNVNQTYAKEYEIKLKTYSNENYNIVNITNGIYTISKRPISILLENQSSIYGDSIFVNQSSYEIIGGTIVNNDSLGISLSTDAVANQAKDYTLTLSYTNENYNVSTNQAKYTVEKREVSVLVLNQTFTYGEQFEIDNSKYNITQGSFVFNDQNLAYLHTLANALSNSGEYEIDFKLNNPNYILNITKGCLTLSKRVLTISLNVNEIEYGEQLDISSSQIEYISGNIVNNDNVSIFITTDLDQNNSVGNYTVSANSSNSNYEIVISNNEITVLKKEITISVNQTGIYGNVIDFDAENYKIVSGEIIKEDSLDLILSTTATKTSNVGKYEITLVSANENYNVTLIDSYYTIQPKTLNINLLSQTYYYGDIIKLDSSAYTINNSEILEGTDANIVLSTNATSKSNVGNYKIYAETHNPNYKLSKNESNLTIVKRKIVIRLYNQTIYHSFHLNLNKEDYDIISGSVVNKDNLNVELHTDANVLTFTGEHDIYATYNNSNYDVKFINATLTIKFSVTDALIITLIATLLITTISTIVFVIIMKKKNKNKFYNKWI